MKENTLRYSVTMDTSNCSLPINVKTETDTINEEEVTPIDTNNEEIQEIKPEIDIQQTEIDTVQTDNPFGNVQLVVKQETSINEHEHLNIIPDKPLDNIENINSDVNLADSLHVDVKAEKSDDSLVTYDYPNFDDAGSMDSNEATALGNVETCLQEEINIKCENDVHDEEIPKEDFDPTIKIESEVTLPETDLTSNPIIPDVDPNVGPKYSFVMKIPADVIHSIDEMVANGDPYAEDADAFHDDTCTGDPEYDDNVDSKMNLEPYHLNSITGNGPTLLEAHEKTNDFQLNSITGNVLSLDEEAYGLLVKNYKDDGLKYAKKQYPCTKCPKVYNLKHSLLTHMKVHRTIDNYRNGWIKGLKTKRANIEKRLKMMEEKDNDTQKKHKDTKVSKTRTTRRQKDESKEGYLCTCGNAFQRRSRMETCLRSHDLFETNSNCESCMTCSKKFRSKEELSLHRKRMHRKKFPCKFCPTDYDTRKELFKHLQIHQKVQLMEYKVIEQVVKGKQKLRCFMCSKSWTELSELKTHVLTDHKGPYVCPHCKNTFPKIIDFGNHTKTYHPEVEGQSVLDVLEAFSRLVQEWKCDECNLQFLEPDKFALHQIEKHSPELKAQRQYQCPDCRRVFVSQKGLTSHRRIHHSVETLEETKVQEMGIMCLECRKICKDMTALTSHMRFHSPERKYPCKFCDFRFATPEKRKTHAEIHTGDMKYVCFICEYQCTSENRLQKHKMSLKHANMKEYLLTGKPLVEPSTSEEKGKEKKECSAKKRKKTENGRNKNGDSSSDSAEVACDVCGDKFASETEMLEHKQTHPFIEFANDDKPSRIFFK
ncbi:zinc finger protein 616-like [Pectinophora gossypiella]|nr:zinc finger protein 616-like [Pectinophora gossypiella]